MNQELFRQLIEKKPEQCHSEWHMFLEICDLYLKKAGLKRPVIVELGTYNNQQKPFYEQLLGAEHIGIDSSRRRGSPDIHGNTHNPVTLKMLKERLGGKSITILFIDANHRYNDVKQDFEMYSPLCSNIIVFHDLKLRNGEVGKFWNELQAKAYRGEEGYKEFLFVSIYQYRKSRIQMGIGMAIRK